MLAQCKETLHFCKHLARRSISYANNPMFHLDQQSDKSQHWYICHGARDRDTAFQVPVNLATKLMNQGYEVDFTLPWNRGHEGDYILNDLFSWIKSLE